MDNNRQSYENLIQQLRDCPNEAEIKCVLDDCQELATPELLRFMARGAEILRDNEDRNGANSLLSLALEVGEVLGGSDREETVIRETASALSEIGRREYELDRFSLAVQFYDRTLSIYREIKDREGEVDALNGLGKSYRGLKEEEKAITLHQESKTIAREIDYGQGEVDALYGLGADNNSLKKYEEALAYLQEALSIAQAIEYPLGEANALNGLGNVYSNLEEYELAIDFYERSLAVSKEAFPTDWAATQNNLGAAYLYRIKGDKAENLELSIAAYQNALLVRTKDALPQDWAMTQNNLGAAYVYRIKGDRAENLELAIAALENALSVRTKDAFSQSWAATHISLGLAYVYRIKGDTAENLERAIAALENALSVLTKDAFPNDWAGTQNNLGAAYRNRIKGGRAENIELAIAAYENALSVYTKDAFPNDWAMTQNNLGGAYIYRIKGDRAENLEMAIAAVENALSVYTKDAFPTDWATTQMNLGLVYGDRIKGDTAENLELAIAAYQNALLVYTKDAFPIDWAMTQNNLGIAYRKRIKGDTAENLEEAIAAYEKALSVRTKDVFPSDWARTQNNLGNSYSDKIKGDEAENLELAIAAYQNALLVYTKDAFPTDWAGTQICLGAAYGQRIKGDKAENQDLAIAAYENALSVGTKDAFPNHWATTQNNLGVAYSERIKGDRAENLQEAIAAYENALLFRTPKANPVECLRTSRNLGELHFQEGNWQQAIASYKQAITAVELSRSWATNDDRRQQILEEAIDVYQNIIQCFVNLQQYAQAFEYAERSRCKQLVDLVASKDLYQDGNIPEQVRKLLQEHEELQRQIDNIHDSSEKSQLQSGDNRSGIFRTPITRDWRALTKARNENVAKLEKEKREIWEKIRKEDPVIAQGIQVAHLEFSQLQQLIESDRTAIVSFYSTKTDTYLFVLDKNNINLHPCPGEGSDNLQAWIAELWLDLYLSDKEKWSEQMPDFLAELAGRLNIEQLIDNFLQDIDELILIPHQHLHLIPLSALPVGGGYLGDKFPIRTLASCQILSFCQNRDRPESAPSYGIVENTKTKSNLPCSSFEAETVARLYQVSPEKRLQGSQATTVEYKKLLEKVNRVLSCHHAVSRIDDNLESALKLADGEITLGQLLTPAYRFPHLDEVFLSCCETNMVGRAKPTDDILTLNSGFLCAGARGVIGTLWAVDDLAACVFSIIYHERRAQGSDRVRAVQQAQQTLRNMTRQELQKYKKSVKEMYDRQLKAASERRDALKAEESNYVEGSPEYQNWQKERQKAKEDCDRIGKERFAMQLIINEVCDRERPFADPISWSSFICAGLKD